ncbi:MAG: hypothetical protein VW124_12845 [Paracoccaceae bacterium]
MCGIFGIVVSEKCSLNRDIIKSALGELFTLSESRGKEASGVAINCNGQISMLKTSQSASDMLKSKEYSELIGKTLCMENVGSFSAIGHSRLMTNGRNSLNVNNQPVNVNDLVGVHNGIIVNDDEIWAKLNDSGRSELDTEALISLVLRYSDSNDKFENAIAKAFSLIEGNASIALISARLEDLYLATNNGSLYLWTNTDLNISIFASEDYILKKVVRKLGCRNSKFQIQHINSNHGRSISTKKLAEKCFELNAQMNQMRVPPGLVNCESGAQNVVDYSQNDYPDPWAIKRCTKCVLPETFPNITFDIDGICSFCKSYEPMVYKNIDELMLHLEPYRSNDGSPDCLVGLSGGRDSCYGLHVVKKELNMNPIAYTYDWGMVTDTARRNISRMCGKLGVEHILVSADIPSKRSNVRKNIQAWMHNPCLCMIPLFMAGDKQFYYYAHQLRKKTGVDLFLFGAGNVLERTDFKVGFCGLKGNSGKGVLTQLSGLNKIKLASNYLLEFVKNPRYINSSLQDTIWAFYSSYLLRDDYLYLYHYYPWDEIEVEKTLKNEYSWEGAADTSTTWRVGDGTAAFYNYIYYVTAGFTEHDTFRSNQIREGMISRDVAMEKVIEDNKPRWESLDWYAKTIGFNLDEALIKIHNMPRLYK